MTLKHFPALLTIVLFLTACGTADDQPGTDEGMENQTYSFTAVLDGGKSRVSYEDEGNRSDLKMVWDDGDVIRLYPDPSMNDPHEYYDFIANTGAGTSHTVFVHQGYILNWEHWSGKAIYVFPDGDNLEVEVNSKDFPAKAYVQKKNGNTEHLKYAEHELGDDGSKGYTEYWSQFLKDANLKHDHQLTFSHPNTVVYKVMLRGFIFDIPGGSELRMSGDAWPDGEVTALTLGSKDDEEPFVKVGQYGNENYEDNVLTAYIIRQVAGDVDGKIGTGGKLKFELLTYDKLDGTVMPLDPKDTMRKDNPDYGPDYLTNIPWGDEYTWNVTATADIEYKAGDFVVADLTDKSKNHAYPKVAVDMGLPIKWSAFNIGAKKIEEKGEYVVWGHTALYSFGSGRMSDIYDQEWASGDTEHDAASFHWGDGWRTPTFNEFLDLVHYATWYDDDDKPATDAEARWKEDLEPKESRIFYFEKPKTPPVHHINGETNVGLILVRSTANDKFIYLPTAGYLKKGSQTPEQRDRACYCTSAKDHSINPVIYLFQESPWGSGTSGHSGQYYIGYNNYTHEKDINAESLRAVKD